MWLPIEGGKLETLRITDMAGHVETLAREVGDEAEPRFYFHCSAGIHRTGFFVYFLLRLFGLQRNDALGKLAEIRPVTADQVGNERIDLADELLARLIQKGHG